MPQDITGTENFTNGPYQIPSTGDVGDPVFDTLEEFMERMANHQHTGADSKAITVNIEKAFDVHESGVDFSWVSIDTGLFRATLKADLSGSSGATYSNNLRKLFYEDSNGDYVEFFPTVEPINGDDTQFYVISNDNTITKIQVVTF